MHNLNAVCFVWVSTSTPDMLVHALQTGNGETEIASVYDIATQTFTPFHFSTNAFCAGHSVAQDGTAIIAGKPPLDSDRLAYKTQNNRYFAWATGILPGRQPSLLVSHHLTMTGLLTKHQTTGILPGQQPLLRVSHHLTMTSSLT